ncbi:11200_t:CDS:2 [Ambispora gerdemannii]|uniref:11200_t:CDS:1 n=1 Tax=Ambispora gerdemannii TaxID=144530 RepID=A0A9N8Z6J6_9GLOM|nr:11200_t:CDS:2 [Ambispora gerdemannii]
MVKYNLYFGEEAVEYYKPATPETELQTLIDDPDEFKKFKKDHEDNINLLIAERDALATERDKEKAEKKTLTDELADEKKNRDAEKKALEAEILKLDTANKVIEADNKKLQKAINERNAKIAGMVNKADYDAKAKEATDAITALGNKTTEYNVLDGLRYWNERNTERKRIDEKDLNTIATIVGHGGSTIAINDPSDDEE